MTPCFVKILRLLKCYPTNGIPIIISFVLNNLLNGQIRMNEYLFYFFKPKYKRPFIELNGKEYPDSNLIMEMLSKKFDVNPDSILQNGSPEAVLSHSIQVMIEHHTVFHGFYWRYCLHQYEFFSLMRGVKYSINY